MWFFDESAFPFADVVGSSDGNGVSNAKTKSPELDVFPKSVPPTQVAYAVILEGGMSGNLSLNVDTEEGEVAGDAGEGEVAGDAGDVGNVEGEVVFEPEHEPTASGSSGNEAVEHNEACVEGENVGTASSSFDVSIPPVLDTTNSSGSCSGELLPARESVVSQTVVERANADGFCAANPTNQDMKSMNDSVCNFVFTFSIFQWFQARKQQDREEWSGMSHEHRCMHGNVLNLDDIND
ncbi:hypothetical protein V6N13_026420 [Hibiscus sabdariffa]|uniref:Uncharacterized protein n=1 Tax=Hibiscus sabdariffa TaxID=183260 RepID=A0ABR2P663_9ROSI